MIFLVDGMNMVYRYAYRFAGGDVSKLGDPIEAGIQDSMAAFLSTILSNPDWGNKDCQMVVCWEGTSREPKRLKLLPSYKDRDEDKSGKSKEISDLARPIAHGMTTRLQDLLKFTAVDQVFFDEDNPGEADDLIAHIVKGAAKREFPIHLYSNDRDFYQLFGIHDDLTIYKPVRGRRELVEVTERDSRVELDCSPNIYIFVKALTGDNSDNIPGLKGIGAKTAIQAIQDAGFTRKRKLYDKDEVLDTLVADFQRPTANFRLRGVLKNSTPKQVRQTLERNFRLMKLPSPLNLRVQKRATLVRGSTKKTLKVLRRRYPYLAKDFPSALCRQRVKYLSERLLWTKKASLCSRF